MVVGLGNGTPPVRVLLEKDDEKDILRQQLQGVLDEAEHLRFKCRDLEEDIEQLQSVVRHQTEADLIMTSAKIIAGLLMNGSVAGGAAQEQLAYAQRLATMNHEKQLKENAKPPPPARWEE